MKQDFVSNEQALALRGFGFNENSYAYDIINSRIIKLILRQQALKFFRDKYNYYGLIEGGYENGRNIFTYVIWKGSNDNWDNPYYDTYEEAENACIDKLIELAKQQDNGN